jgi:pseudaminic acid cytidylyltransferase
VAELTSLKMTPPEVPEAYMAVIPARGGSKRIPGKNIKDFCGKPMIAWSIETARRSGLFGSIIVSTDDEAIAEVAREWGAEVPFVRPVALADEHTGLRDVMTHAIHAMGELGRRPEIMCCLLATAPLVRPKDLREGLEKLEARGVHFAYSVARFTSPIQRALRIRADGLLEMMWPEHRLTRSQDLEEAYHDAGQFYWGRSASFLDRSKWIPSPLSVPVVLPAERVQDIDTEEDWVRAEWLFRAMMREGDGP